MILQDLYMDVLNKTLELRKKYNCEKICDSLCSNMIKTEFSKITIDAGIKILDSMMDNESGTYIYARKESYCIVFVEDSEATYRNVDKDEIIELLSISYLVRVNSILPITNFEIIKFMTKDANSIVNKYRED